MIVSQADIEFVVRGRCRHLILPVERGSMNQLLPCPVEVGVPFKLWTGERFVKGMNVTPTEILGTTADRVEPPRLTVGEHREAGGVWLITFVRGDHSGFYRRHRERYLKARGVGLTDDPRQAVRGEPAVTTEEQLALARRARERRELEDRQRYRQLAAEIEQLKRRADNPQAKQLLKRMIRNLDALGRILPSEAPVKSAPVQQLGSAARTSRPPDAEVAPTPSVDGRAA